MNKIVQEIVATARIEDGQPRIWSTPGTVEREAEQRAVFEMVIREVLAHKSPTEILVMLADVARDMPKRAESADYLMALNVYQDGEFPYSDLDAKVKENNLTIKDLLIGTAVALLCDTLDPQDQED